MNERMNDRERGKASRLSRPKQSRLEMGPHGPPRCPQVSKVKPAGKLNLSGPRAKSQGGISETNHILSPVQDAFSNPQSSEGCPLLSPFLREGLRCREVQSLT